MNELRLQRLEPILPSYDVRTRIKQDDLVFSRQAVQEATQKVNASFESLRLGRTPSFPIPAEKCVPIMATKKQVLEYESVFLNSAPEVLQDKTISEILQPYSYLTEPTKTGKIQFLLKFFSCIRGMNVNLDVAIVCSSHKSESNLIEGLDGHNLNYKSTSVLLPQKRVYGVIVKTRKNDITIKPVVRTDVDIVMVYDSAMEYPQAKIDIFQGATYENPLVIYLTTMDTADIRLYDSTCHNQLSWNSKLVKISHVDQHRIFYQINRKQANDFEVLSWNEFVASQVAQWASVKLEKNYSFECPKKKHPLLKVYLSFALAHPRVQVKVKNKTTVQPIAIASPYQQTPTITATATATSGPSKPKSLPKKKKENANLIPMSNANRFATVSKNTTAITDAAPFTEMTNNNVKGKGKAKAQNSSSSIPCSISTTPGSVGFDLMDIEVENSAAARPTTTTTMASQSYSIPSKSVHPDRLALPESSTTLSVVPSKRTSDLDLNDDSYGTSGKRARDSAVDATSKAFDTTNEANSQNQLPTNTTVDDSASFSNGTDEYNSFLQEALKQFEQEMLNISVNF